MSTTDVREPQSRTGQDASIPMKTAKITLGFKEADFRSIGEGLITEYTMALTNPGDAPTGPGGRKDFEKVGDVIRVNNRGAKLEFRIASNKYRPVGITFKEKQSGAEVPTSGGRFGNLKVDEANKILEIVNNITPPAGGPPSRKLFKFSVTVRRVSDNADGIIDPDLENEN